MLLTNYAWVLRCIGYIEREIVGCLVESVGIKLKRSIMDSIKLVVRERAMDFKNLKNSFNNRRVADSWGLLRVVFRILSSSPDPID